MIHLGTMILSSDGAGMAPVGKFLHGPDWPPWSTTLAADGAIATIRGATVVDAEDLGQQALCLVVDGREKAPLIADEKTRVYSVDEEHWVPLTKLKHGEAIRVPERSPNGLIVTWARVRKVMRAPLPDRLWMDANKMWGRMVLARGAWSYASPCAFVHQ